MSARGLRSSASWRVWSLVLIQSAVATLSCHASEDADREIVRTYFQFYLRQKAYDEGWKVLTEHLQKDPKDSSIWNLLGLLYLDASQPSRAIAALGKAVETSDASSPLHGVYLYNYADAWARQGDEGKARAALQSAGKYQLTSAQANQAIRGLQAGHPLPSLSGHAMAAGEFTAVEASSREGWSGRVSLSSGYDTNVLLYSDSALAELGRSDTASPMVSVASGLGYLKDFGTTDLSANGSAAFSYFSNPSSRVYNHLISSVGLGWGDDPEESDSFLNDISARGDLSYLNTDGFRFYYWDANLGWQGTSRGQGGSAWVLGLNLLYNKFAVETGDDPVNDRTGPGLHANLGYQFALGSGVFSVGAAYERLFTRGDHYRSHSFLLPMSFTQKLFWQMDGSIGLEASSISYLQSDTGRHDSHLKAGMTLGRQFRKSWGLQLSYAFDRNVSNVDSAEYNRHSLTLVVNHALF